MLSFTFRIGFFFTFLLFGLKSYALECQHLQPIMVKLMSNHVSSPSYNATLENRAIDQYIKTIDGGKLYLLQDDVQKIRRELRGFYNRLRRRDCKFIDEVQKVFIGRLEERAKFAETYINSVEEIDKTIEFVLDPKAREYAKTKKELDELQKKHIHLQLANIVSTDVELKEAKEMLVRRYNRVLRQTTDKSNVDLYAGFLEAFAHTLDPHSSYFSKKMLEDFQINMSLSLEGIGATLSSQDGHTVIEQLVSGGAAAKSGEIIIKDKILAVGQGDKGEFEVIYDMELSDVVRLIRGKRGTKVRLRILRSEGGKNTTTEVTLTREKINLEDEAAQISYIERKVDGKKKVVGFLSLPSFYSDNTMGGRSSANDVRKLLIEASKKGVDSLVLDLSSNGGGSLDDAVKIAGMFFRTGNVVSHERTKLADNDPAIYYTGPLVVLTSRASASASEIVSGALKDYNRALVVGADHTFGKGSVQQVMRLGPELGAIKFTVGLFYLPGGQSTQHSGVESHIVFPSALHTDDIGEKSLDYSIPPDSIPSFISQSAFEMDDKNRWTPLSPDLISEVRTKSEKRIKENEDFQKILADLEKNKGSRVIRIAEIFDNAEDSAAKKRERRRSMSREERHKEYLESAEVKEAVNIGLDLAKLISSSLAKTLSSNKPAKAN